MHITHDLFHWLFVSRRYVLQYLLEYGKKRTISLTITFWAVEIESDFQYSKGTGSDLPASKEPILCSVCRRRDVNNTLRSRCSSTSKGSVTSLKLSCRNASASNDDRLNKMSKNLVNGGRCKSPQLSDTP